MLQNYETRSLGTGDPLLEIGRDPLGGNTVGADVPVVSVLIPDDRGEAVDFLRDCANTVVNLLEGGMSKDGLIQEKNRTNPVRWAPVAGDPAAGRVVNDLHRPSNFSKDLSIGESAL